MTHRFPLESLDAASGSPSQFPRINDAGDAVEWATPTVGGSGLLGSVQQVAATADTQYTSLSPVDVAGLSVGLDVIDATRQFLVVVALHVRSYSSTTPVLFADLNVDGVAQSTRMQVRVANTEIVTETQTYLLNGLAPGAHTIKVTANLSASGEYRIHGTHSTMTVLELSPPDTGGIGVVDGGTWDSAYADFIDGGAF